MKNFIVALERTNFAFRWSRSKGLIALRWSAFAPEVKITQNREQQPALAQSRNWFATEDVLMLRLRAQLRKPIHEGIGP